MEDGRTFLYLGFAFALIALARADVDSFFGDFDADASNTHELMMDSLETACNDFAYDHQNLVGWEHCPDCPRADSVCEAIDEIDYDTGEFGGGFECTRVPEPCREYLAAADLDPGLRRAGRPRPRPRPPSSSSSSPKGPRPRCIFTRRIPAAFNKNTCRQKPSKGWKVYKGRCIRARRGKIHFCRVNLARLAFFGSFPSRAACRKACSGKKGGKTSRTASASRRRQASPRTQGKEPSCRTRRQRCLARFEARKPPRKGSPGCMTGAKKGRRAVVAFRQRSKGSGYCRPVYYYGCRAGGGGAHPVSLRKLLIDERENLFTSRKACKEYCCA